MADPGPDDAEAPRATRGIRNLVKEVRPLTCREEKIEVRSEKCSNIFGIDLHTLKLLISITTTFQFHHVKIVSLDTVYFIGTPLLTAQPNEAALSLN